VGLAQFCWLQKTRTLGEAKKLKDTLSYSTVPELHRPISFGFSELLFERFILRSGVFTEIHVQITFLLDVNLCGLLDPFLLS
jgi:hypothetical protein